MTQKHTHTPPTDTGTDTPAFLMHDLARLLRAEFERQIAESGLGITPVEGRILITLAIAGPLRQHNLAERLVVTRMTLTGVLTRLEDAGLIARCGDPGDGRARVVSLTPKAHAVVPRIRAIGGEARDIARGEIGAAAWQAFLTQAHQARQNLLTHHQKRGRT